MDTTTLYLAKMFGLVFTVVGLSLLINREYYKQVIEDLMKSPALMYITGVIWTVAGAAMLMVHHQWVGGVTALVTLLAWITFLKGIGFILWPQFKVEMMKSFNQDSWFAVGGVIALVLGLYLGYVGFLA